MLLPNIKTIFTEKKEHLEFIYDWAEDWLKFFKSIDNSVFIKV